MKLIGLLGLFATIAGAFPALHDHFLSRKIEAAGRGPTRIRRPLTGKQILLALRRLKRTLRQTRFEPEVVLSVHMSGLPIAALIADDLGCGVCRSVGVVYRARGSTTECEDVVIDRDTLRRLQGKAVLLVENRVGTGRTLATVRRKIEELTSDVRTMTLVAVDQDASTAARRADYVMFWARKRFPRLFR